MVQQTIQTIAKHTRVNPRHTNESEAAMSKQSNVAHSSNPNLSSMCPKYSCNDPMRTVTKRVHNVVLPRCASLDRKGNIPVKSLLRNNSA